MPENNETPKGKPRRRERKDSRGSDDGLYVRELGECPSVDEGDVREKNRRIRKVLDGD